VSADLKLRLFESPRLFEEAKAFADATIARLRRLLGPEVTISHVGATAVPGCLTKGDVDIVVHTESKSFSDAREILDGNYAKNLGSPRDDNFTSYSDDTGAFPLGIQLVVSGSEHDTFERFAERLRQSDVLLASYNELKRSFAGADMEIYRKAKAGFIARVLAGSGE